MEEPEALGIAGVPLEVVEQAPVEIATHVHAQRIAVASACRWRLR
jgi:hypothetical protein